MARDGASAGLRAAADRAPSRRGIEAIYHAMVLGLRDYVNKNRFPGVVLGLSGGIDSRALGGGRGRRAGRRRGCTRVMMPSPYTSRATAWRMPRECARAARHRADDIVPSGRRWRRSARCWRRCSPDRSADITEENIQSRARGVTLMAISNKFGGMVLTTGNKSRDGGRLRHALRRHVRRLFGAEGRLQDAPCSRSARWRNAHRPAGALGPAGRGDARARHHQAAVAPSCKPDQTDQDTLPPYDVLDAILKGLVEREMPVRRARRARPRRGDGARASGACSTAPNTSAARRRRA